MRLNKTMRFSAMKAATNCLYKDRVEKLKNKLNKDVYEYVKSLPENVESQKIYKECSEDMKKLIQAQTSVYFGVNNKSLDLGVHPEYVGTTSNFSLLPFDKHSRWGNRITFPFPIPCISLGNNVKKESEFPKFLQKYLKDQKELISEIEEFMSNTMTALAGINNKKELVELMPNMASYFEFTSSSTGLLPLEAIKKINAKLA